MDTLLLLVTFDFVMSLFMTVELSPVIALSPFIQSHALLLFCAGSTAASKFSQLASLSHAWLFNTFLGCISKSGNNICPFCFCKNTPGILNCYMKTSIQKMFNFGSQPSLFGLRERSLKNDLKSLVCKTLMHHISWWEYWCLSDCL